MFKIGENIIATKEFILSNFTGNNEVRVKEGDEAILTKDGIYYLNGEAVGKIELMDTSKINEYDVKNIAKSIFNNIEKNYGIFEETLDDYDLESNDIIEAITEELNNFI